MQKLTIYYDGQCPLCQAEIEFLKTRNHENLLASAEWSEAHLEDAADSVAAMLLQAFGELGAPVPQA